MLVERDQEQYDLILYRMENIARLAMPCDELQVPQLPQRLDGILEKHYPFKVRPFGNLLRV